MTAGEIADVVGEFGIDAYSLASRPEPRSQAEEALRRVIAARRETLEPLPSDPAERRRAMNVRGW